MPRLLALALVLTAATAARAERVTSHPLVAPYPGSRLNGNETEQLAYEEFRLPVARRDEADPTKNDLVIPGKVTRLEYDNPSDRSQLEIYRNYESALKKAGFTILFQCEAQKCGSDKQLRWLGRYGYGGGEQRYLAAKLARPDGDAYVGLNVGSGTQNLVIVEAKPMENDLVKVDADALRRELQSNGHVAVYGILFDTDRATLKPESKDALEQVAKLLAKDATLKLYVVGHTDDAGKFDHNMALSQSRAEAVIKELSGTYKVDAKRLKAGGAGPLVPVASNLNDQGKAKNRRVELVQRIAE